LASIYPFHEFRGHFSCCETFYHHWLILMQSAFAPCPVYPGPPQISFQLDRRKFDSVIKYTFIRDCLILYTALPKQISWDQIKNVLDTQRFKLA
jgi:hypothetical protein